MATNILIMGESGTGKSTSIRNLNPRETFVINVLDKPLPFKGFKTNYIKYDKGQGNYFASDNYNEILRMINIINRQRMDIKNVIIDDFQYIMANEFMRRASERGYDKFTEIGKNAWSIARECSAARDDLFFCILSHTETDSFGKVKCKTIGKMIDEKVTLEGMFTIVLHSLVIDGNYKFLTQNDGTHIAKSPLDMFDKQVIDNDLCYVKTRVDEYFGYDAEWYKNLDKTRKDKQAIIETEQEEFKHNFSLVIDSIMATESLQDLKTKFDQAVSQYKGNNEAISDIINAKDNRKNELNGVQH